MYLIMVPLGSGAARPTKRQVKQIASGMNRAGAGTSFPLAQITVPDCAPCAASLHLTVQTSSFIYGDSA